jgi:3-deoxy-D-manno-octulosonic-acid transferase
MRLLYTLILGMLLPFAVLRLLWRSLRAPDYRRRLGERFGIFAPPSRTGGIWIHAVSVGEAQAAEPMVRRLLRDHPELPLTITTTTPTGSARVRERFGERVFHVYFPYDIPFALKFFLDAVRPKLLVMVETEIWPNLLRQTRQRGIRTLLANARLSQRSARGYRRFEGFTRQVFGDIDRIAAQNEHDAQRFAQLGVDRQRIQVTGSIKFDQTIPASLRERAELLKLSWAGRPAWAAASTHDGEEEQVIRAHRQVLEQVPAALLVLAPRHPERFDRVAGMVGRMGLTLTRRSAGESVAPDTQVLLCDTMGELPLFLAAVDAAFIGGSLVDVGGHNMLEASVCAIPVVFGPHTYNFAVISELLLERQAARRIGNSQQLAECIHQWLLDASLRATLGDNGRIVVEENRGALERLLAMLEEEIGDNPPPPPSKTPSPPGRGLE